MQSIIIELYRRLMRLAPPKPGQRPGRNRFDLEIEEDRKLREKQRQFEDDELRRMAALAAAEAGLRANSGLYVGVRANLATCLLALGSGSACTAADLVLNVPVGLHIAQIEVLDIGAANTLQALQAGGMAAGLTMVSLATSAAVLVAALPWRILSAGGLLGAALIGSFDRAGGVIRVGQELEAGSLNLVPAGLLCLAAVVVPLAGAACFERARQGWRQLLHARQVLTELERTVAACNKAVEKAQTVAEAAHARRLEIRDGWDLPPVPQQATAEEFVENAGAVNMATAEDAIKPESDPPADPKPPPGPISNEPAASLDATSGWIFLGVVIFLAFCGFNLSGCDAPAPLPIASTLIVRDDTSRTQGAEDLAGADLAAVVDQLLVTRPPMGSTFRLVVPGKGATPAVSATLTLSSDGSTDPRILRANFAPALHDFVATPAPVDTAGSGLFAALRVGLRDAPTRPTAIVVVSDLMEVSTYGRRRLNFERLPLPMPDEVQAILAEEHVFPDLTGIPVVACGLDPMLSPKDLDNLTELWNTTLRAAGAVDVDIHTSCADISAPRR